MSLGNASAARGERLGNNPAKVAGDGLGDYPAGPAGRICSIQFTPQLLTKVAIGFSGSGTITSAAGGATTNADDTVRPWVAMSTGTTLNNDGSYVGTAAEIRLDWLAGREAVFFVKTGSVLTTSRIFIGLGTGTPTSADAPVTNFVGVRYSTGVPDSGWVAYSANGSSGTASAKIADIAASTEYRIRLRAVSATQVEVWINEVLCATVTATLPASTTYLNTLVYIRALAGSAARTLSLSRIVATLP